MAQRIPLEVGDLPDNVSPLEMVTVVKFMDDSGEVSLAIRMSDGLSHWEAIGMLVAGGDAARQALIAEFTDRREDPDESP